MPRVERLLAVVAHPDDETFGLGAILSEFVDTGAVVDVLCFTRGGASELGVEEDDLAELREQELRDAVAVLRITNIAIFDYGDGALGEVPSAELVGHIEVHAGGVDALVVFDEGGITGHPDHRRATEAATAWAQTNDVAVLAWVLPVEVANQLNDEFRAGFIGRTEDSIDFDLRLDRTTQLRAIDCHRSQAQGNAVLARRLQLQGNRECMRYLTTKRLDHRA